MIIVDTEYTTWPGALECGWSKPGQHREIVQIAAIKVDERLAETAHVDLLVVPLINPILSDVFVKLTGITQTMLDEFGRPFDEQVYKFVEFCDQQPVICMNADEAVFIENCRINDLRMPFRASFHRLRPFLEQQGIDLTEMSSGDLHKLTNRPLLNWQTHYALHDVRSMARWLQQAQEDGIFTSADQLPTGAPDHDPRSAGQGATVG